MCIIFTVCLDPFIFIFHASLLPNVYFAEKTLICSEAFLHPQPLIIGQVVMVTWFGLLTESNANARTGRHGPATSWLDWAGKKRKNIHCSEVGFTKRGRIHSPMTLPLIGLLSYFDIDAVVAISCYCYWYSPWCKFVVNIFFTFHLSLTSSLWDRK